MIRRACRVRRQRHASGAAFSSRSAKAKKHDGQHRQKVCLSGEQRQQH
jgi:hypothetical protein